MPFKTRYGSHYHMTEGCHGATIPCDTKGLTPCSDCCGKGSDRAGGTTVTSAGASAGAGSGQGFHSGSIEVDSEIIGVFDTTLGGVRGTLYKLDRLLDPEERRAISALEGAQTVIVEAQYAPELKRTGVFVERGYSYSIGRADEIVEAGIQAMTDPVAAPSVDIIPPVPSDDRTPMSDGLGDVQSVYAVDPADSSALAEAAWQEAGTDARERFERQERVAAYTERAATISDITGSVGASMRRDPDVSDESYYVSRQTETLLDACEIRPIGKGRRDSYTTALVSQYVVFAACHEGYIGGSEADYCASHVNDALEGYEIRLRDDADGDAILARIRKGIDESALYRDREYGELSGAGVPIFRTKNMDEEAASQAAEGQRLSRMSRRERQAMWRSEAREWADLWAGSRELRGEGRTDRVVRSFPEIRVAKEAARMDMQSEVTRTGSKLSRRYGDAYTEAMTEERSKAYSAEVSNALRTLSSRMQSAQQHDRLHGEAMRAVEATRDYGEMTMISHMYPEERRQIAMSVARIANDPRRPPAELRARRAQLEAILDGGTVGDLRGFVGDDPVGFVDDACAETIIRLRAQGKPVPRQI